MIDLDIPPPWSPDAEVAVLGAMLIDRTAIPEVRSVITPADFYRLKHALVYESALAVFDAGRAVDVITMAEHMTARGKFNDAGGYDLLAALVDAVPTAANVKHHARIVREKAERRRLIAACVETMRRATTTEDADELFRETEALLLGATARRGPKGFEQAGQAALAAIARAEEAQATSDGIVGMRSGIPKLDWLTCGFEPGLLTVLAARPSMGKSAMGWQFGEHVAGDEHGVCLASYEMGASQLGRRGLARIADIDSNKIRRGRLDRFEWDSVVKASSRLGTLPLWISDQPPVTVEGLRSMVQRHMAKHHVRMLIVDYVQQMAGPKNAGNRNNEVEHISRGLKRMAADLGIHVVALAQLSRGVERRDPPRPILSDLRDSGAIEQDADNVLLLWRPEYYFDEDTPDEARSRWQGRAELILAKQRDGDTGSIVLSWDGPKLRFGEIERTAAAQQAHRPQPSAPLAPLALDLAGAQVDRLRAEA